MKIIVIGSGFGGLSAGIRLRALGHEVTLLEKLDKLGGRAYVFEQDGFKFDAGPTIITGHFLLQELWHLAGRRLEDDIDLRRSKAPDRGTLSPCERPELAVGPDLGHRTFERPL